MAVEPKALSVPATELPSGARTRALSVPTEIRRSVIWAQVVVVFVLLEFALWAPTTHLRNRWALVATFTMLVAVFADHPSIKRLGLGLPKIRGAGAVLGIGLAGTVLQFAFVNWLGGEIPANPAWFPDWRSAWGYVLWALMQEFILQSFFFTRFEELYGGSAAVWIAAALFSAVHLPSPVLTTATLIGALFFCEMFRRCRSIYMLGVVHAMLGLTLALVTPDSLLHHMRVGIGYLQY